MGTWGYGQLQWKNGVFLNIFQHNCQITALQIGRTFFRGWRQCMIRRVLQNDGRGFRCTWISKRVILQEGHGTIQGRNNGDFHRQGHDRRSWKRCGGSIRTSQELDNTWLTNFPSTIKFLIRATLAFERKLYRYKSRRRNIWQLNDYWGSGRHALPLRRSCLTLWMTSHTC